MKKNFLYYFIFTSFFSFSQEMTELEYNDLKGNVKSFVQTEYTLFKDHPMEESYKTVFEFNKKGAQTFVKYYRRFTNNKLHSTLVSKMDSSENIIEKIAYENDTLLINRMTYIYNSKNQKIQENHHAKNGIITENYLFNYDEKNNLIEKSIYGYGNFVLKNVYHYDEKNRLILTEIFNKKNEITSKYGVIYDKDNVIERNSWNIDNPSFNRKTTFSYSSNNLYKKATEYYNELIKYVMEYQFDSYGNQLSLIIKYPNGRKNITLKTFDSNHNLIEIKEFENDILTSNYFYSYVYDDKNNWIEKREKDSKEDDLPYLTKRNITYFE